MNLWSSKHLVNTIFFSDIIVRLFSSYKNVYSLNPVINLHNPVNSRKCELRFKQQALHNSRNTQYTNTSYS